jgi:hypothetical protein
MKNLMLALFIVTIGFMISCEKVLSPEQQQQVQSLKSELSQVKNDIAAAKTEDATLSGGLVKALITMRMEILKANEALIQQRIHAIESGAKITIEVPGYVPDLEMAKQIEEEMKTQGEEVRLAREEAKHAGGLIGAMRHATLATAEQSLAMLRMRYLSAKYGLAITKMQTEDTPKQLITGSIKEQAAGDKAIGKPKKLSDEIISVKVIKKEYKEESYKKSIIFNLQFTAIGLDKPARAIKGILNFQDLFGDIKYRVTYSIDEPIEVGETVPAFGGGIDYNQFKSEHNWLKNISTDNLTTSFTVTNILYQDGSRKDLE